MTGAVSGAARPDELAAAFASARGAFSATGLFSFAINLLMLVSPLYMLQVYDRVLASRSASTLVALTVLAGGMLLVMGLLELIRSRVLVRIGSGLDRQLGGRVFEATMGLSLAAPGGGTGAQSLRDLESLRQFLSGPGPFALFDAPWVPIYIAVVFLFHPLLGLVALVGAVVIFILALLNEVLTRDLLREANREAAAAGRLAEGALRNAEALTAMGMLEALKGRWRGRYDKALSAQSRASDRGGAITAGSKSLRLFLQVAILGVGAWLSIQQIITPGVMIAASIIMGRALAPVEQAIGHWRAFVQARQAHGRLKDLLTRMPPPPERLALPEPKGALELEAAAVAPPGGRKPVLQGISFTLQPGEALGVIGPSASGKSSLAKLLTGVWPPLSGAVRLDGAELHKWDRAALGKHIGYLPQEVELFEGRVSENICRFAAEPEAGDIHQAAEQAGVREMILKLPEGFDSEIGAGGRVLSGGQRQRIGLARALYGGPALVVLDEPNSNLDAAGDQALTRAIQALKSEGATVVVMAHRPSAIAAVDKLLMLGGGSMQAFGPKKEVLAAVAEANGKVAQLRPQDAG